MYLVCYCLPAFLFFCTKKIKDRTTQHWVRGFRSERVRATQNSRSLIEAHPRVIPCTRLACREPHTQRSQVTHSSQKSSNFIKKNKVQRRRSTTQGCRPTTLQLLNYMSTSQSYVCRHDSRFSQFTAPRQRCFLSEVEERREKWWRGAWLERAFLAFLFLFHGRGLRDLLS